MDPLALNFNGTDRFQLLRVLGHGGMGVVYEALDRSHATKLALKVLPLVSPERLMRFKREFRVASSIHHPNLVRLGELVRFGDHWFFTMELVEGVDVLEYVRGTETSRSGSGPRSTLAWSSDDGDEEPAITVGFETPRVPVLGDLPKLRAVMQQLASALYTLHEAGCIHRDVKPSNALVTREGRLVLLDFGLASVASQQSTLFVAGTPLYMAPEQAGNQPASPAADWYSFGVVLFELLTGTLPFCGHMYEVLSAKQGGRAPRVQSVLPDVPDDLASLCDALLVPDPKARPRGAEVLERLGQPQSIRASSPNARASSAPLIGREPEWAALCAARDRVEREGRAQVVVLSGESGVGKSTLAHAFLDSHAHTPEVLTFFSRCYERELVPFKAVDGLLDAVAHFLRHAPEALVDRVLPARAGVIAQVFPVLARVEALGRATLPDQTQDLREVRTWLFAALRELLVNIGHERLVIALIDDLHWADHDSMVLLSELFREPETPRVLLLCTQRTQGPSHGNKVFAQEVEEQNLHLENLSLAAAESLALRLADERAQRVDCARLAQESGGHPLFLRELLDAALSEPQRGAQLTLDHVLRRRLATLPSDPASVLKLLAVSGAPLPASVLREAAGTGGQAFADALHALRSERLVHAAGEIFDDRLDISHDRLRRVVSESLSADEAVSLHRQLASALEECGEPVLSAAHWREAHSPERAAQHYVTAGKLALDALAFGEAESHYRAALSLGSFQNGERSSLLSALGDALSNAGKGLEAAEQYRSAAQVSSSGLAVELKRRAAEELVRSGYLDEGLKVAREVLEDAHLKPAKSPLYALLLQRTLLRLRGLSFRVKQPRELSDKELARIDLCWSMSSGLVLTDTFQGAYFQARGLALSLRAGEPYRIARSIAAEAAYNASRGHRYLARAQELFELAEELADLTKDPRATGTALLMRGIAAHFHGRFAEGRTLLHRASAVFREQCTGMFWERDAARQFWLECLFYLGDLAALKQSVRLGLREAQERGAIYTATNLRTGLANAIWLLDDAPDKAQAALFEAMRRWSAQGFHVQHWYALIAEVHILLYRGEPLEAEALLAARWPELARSHLLRINHLRVVAQHLRGRVALACAQTCPDAQRGAYIARALQVAETLKRRERGWGALLGELLHLGAARGANGHAEQRDVEALAQRLEASDQPLYARLLRAAALGETQALKAEGVVNPEAFARMMVPGFG